MCFFDDETLFFDLVIGLLFKWPGYGVLRLVQILRGDSSEKRPGTIPSVLVGLALWGVVGLVIWKLVL